MKLFYLSLLSILISGCATPMALSLNKQDKPFTNFEAGKSQVFFFRDCSFAGAARGVIVLKDKERIGGLNCGTYFVYQAVPGKYNFSAEDWLRKEEILTMDIVADKKYYIRADLSFGLLDADPYLETLSETEAKPIVNSLTYVLPQ